MRNWKQKVVASILTISLIIPVQVGAAGKFSDVGTRFSKEIEYLAGRNIVKGYNNGTFGVNEPVTRGEAVVMLTREMGLRFDGAPDPGFTDFKKGDGFYTEVAEAVEQGIIQGKTGKDGSLYFDPEGSLTRSHMALILTRAYDIPLDRQDVKFKDVPPSLEAKQAINALANAGITIGYDDSSFHPFSSITRQEFAALLARTVSVDFNKMSLQFVNYDPVTHQRVKPVWLSDEEIRVKEEQLADLINEARSEKGLPVLKKNERLFEMARLKTRAFVRFPHEDYVLTQHSNFYKELYGEELTKEVQENIAAGSVEKAFSRLMKNSITEPSIFEENQTDIGVGLTQDMDGSYKWFVFFLYK
ncbi:S-layer homology domain-containing protein [Chungangia koreensis]|uniref:S-layer homology domain-containing protein n=1 Tax=Chungangia koreensis TaxID=752657 RepID=A0ABV8X6Q8_9LACT